MQKSFYSIKESKCRFLLLVSFRKIKGLPGNVIDVITQKWRSESQFVVNLATVLHENWLLSSPPLPPPPPQPSNGAASGCYYMVPKWGVTTTTCRWKPLYLQRWELSRLRQQQLFITFNLSVLAVLAQETASPSLQFCWFEIRYNSKGG